jgi:hypothetical protein
MKRYKDGIPFDIFGVRLRTQDDIVQEVFGAQLQSALREACARVGDSVEIIKLGTKDFHNKKAPMNLYQVTKLLQPTRHETEDVGEFGDFRDHEAFGH